MPGKHNRSVNILSLFSFAPAIWTQVKKRHICAILLFGLLACGNGYAQTPLPSPSPAPTPITKSGNIVVNNPSTVGRISKWVTSSNNGIGTIGDSLIIESSIGTIGIGTNPFSDFRLGVDGGNTVAGGVFGKFGNLAQADI